MQSNRRTFIKEFGKGFGLAAAAAAVGVGDVWAVGAASGLKFLQIVYPGGNWCPRSTALRRLAWELHKRTAIETTLEPHDVKSTLNALSASPLAYLSGDRPFTPWSDIAVSALSRYLRLGGTLIVDPAYTQNGDTAGFNKSFDDLAAKVMPEVERKPLAPSHVIYRSFYQVNRPVGRVKGPDALSGYPLGKRMAMIRTDHDLGGAWARDNLGNWEHSVTPGGERQREAAFRLGINLVMYALCLDYKDEQPHRRFDRREVEA